MAMRALPSLVISLQLLIPPVNAFPPSFAKEPFLPAQTTSKDNIEKARHFFWSGLNKSTDSSEFKEALADFNQAISLNPQYVDAYNARSDLKFYLGDFQGAIDDLNQVLLITPDNPETLFRRGMAKLQLSDREGAIEDFSKAIIYRHPTYDAYYQRGLARLESGDPAGAINDFTESMRFDEATAPAFNSSPYRERGMAKLSLGDIKGAIKDFEYAIAINELDGKAHYHLGLARLSQGARQMGCRAIQAANELDYTEAGEWLQKSENAWCRTTDTSEDK